MCLWRVKQNSRLRSAPQCFVSHSFLLLSFLSDFDWSPMETLCLTGWIIFAGVLITSVPAIVALKLKRMSGVGLAASQQVSDLSRHAPFVSVIMPARNEEIQIAEALRTLLKCEGVTLEIIAVNDRSTDKTGAIMDEVARSDSRVRVIHIQELPDNWLGKNHAMHQASLQARGTWLLFTDGDILFQPGTIAAAVRYMQYHSLKHLCLLPEMIPGSLIENVLTTFFGMCFAIGMQLHLIRTRFPLSYAGVGAFNMVDADFYRKVGGHIPIRLDVLDGGRSDFLLADEWLSVRWQPSLWGVVTGLEKNAFASMNYSLRRIGVVTLLFIAIFVAPFVLPLLVPFQILTMQQAGGFLATAVLWHALFAWTVWPVPNGLRMIPFFVAGPWLMAFAYWRSAIITLRQGGVRWRNSFYPLKQLRAAMYR